jgi:uncharacterized protein
MYCLKMLIETQTIGTNARSFDVVIPSSEIDLESDGDEITADVSLTGQVKLVDRKFEIGGTLSTQLNVVCARCLDPIALPLTVVFQATYVSPEVFNSTEEHELEGDALTVDILEGESIDLNTVAREQILLNLPEQLFCNKECKGLCDKCGANRNLIVCKCIDEEIDPRWSALKNLN